MYAVTLPNTDKFHDRSTNRRISMTKFHYKRRLKCIYIISMLPFEKRKVVADYTKSSFRLKTLVNDIFSP